MTRKEFLIISVLTFITICAWVVFDIIHTRENTEISPKLQEVIQPIGPDFDLSGLNTTSPSSPSATP